MENIHQLITETVPVFFFIYNPETQVIEYLSPQFYTFINNTEELKNLDPKEKLTAVIHPDDLSKFEHFFDDLSRKNKYESSVELKTKTGICKIEWFELNTFHPPKEAEAMKVVGHIVDITAKKRQYEILKLENEGIENVMNMMAHDLKAPLANITLVTNLIEEMMNGEEVKKFEKYLKILKTTSKDSAKLIDKLLDLATLKGETSKLDLDLHDLRYSVKEVVEKMQLRIDGKKIKITCRFPDYSVEALLDSGLFKQVIENLLSNALKFTPEKGEIILSVDYSEDKILLSVKDNGIGIPEEHLDNLFEGISTIKRAGLNGEPSTGLGLYICRQIITIHKGTILAKRNKEEGTTFYIKLPVPGASAAYF